ncbi:MAG: ATP-NAD kinase family protein [Candidatus Lokiarchaeota archaeon]|nr:ATP-NAD kinase family protein [Candidatus Lokiarchaeota archaeon]
MRKIGFIINPIAGMGGSVGLKGTDGDIYKEALKRGAKPITPKRVSELLSYLIHKERIFMLVAPGNMGADVIEGKSIKFKIIGDIGETTSANDTKRIAKQMVKEGIELLIFCGGDGTARDIYDAIGLERPVVAVPGGVKMYSSVFTFNPKAAAQIIDGFLEDFIETEDREILDIDEELVRKDMLKATMYGYLKVLTFRNLIQAGKEGSKLGRTIEENKQEIAQWIIEDMKEDTLYLLGPGTTVKAITDNLGLPKTLLGIDAIINKKFKGKDLNEKGILKLLEAFDDAEIIISPIGGQGFIFGRGNKQFTSKVIKKVGKKNIKIISTDNKIRNLRCLRVDTGDANFDTELKGLVKVIKGYKEVSVIQIEC